MGIEGYEHYIRSRQIGLVYSPDDNGYYWEETYGNWRHSKLFATKEKAMAADEDKMEWE